MTPLTHPLQRWPRGHRRLALICVSLAAVIPMVLGAAVKPLHEDRPNGEGIIAFEFAGSVERADEIVDKWRAEGVLDDAKAIQIFDLFYPLIYALALAGWCLAAAGAWARLGAGRLAGWGTGMAWVAFAAAGFDYVENLGLGVSLWDEPASPWPQLALTAATLKFAAIALSLLYALSGVIAALVAWRGRAARPT